MLWGSVDRFQWLQKIIKKNKSIFSRLVLPFSCPSLNFQRSTNQKVLELLVKSSKNIWENIFGGNNMTSKSVNLLVGYGTVSNNKTYFVQYESLLLYHKFNLCRFEFKIKIITGFNMSVLIINKCHSELICNLQT